MVRSEASLVQLALALGAADVGGPLSPDESKLIGVSAAEPDLDDEVCAAKSAICSGRDPLGEAFYELRDAATRRAVGAVYTPGQLVGPMVDWSLEQNPDRIVDCGVGSGRFLAEVIRRRPRIEAIAVDIDPLATLITRAMLAVMKTPHVRVIQGDYTKLALPSIAGRTAFIGNPPYVRHHQLSAEMKAWAQAAASSIDVSIRKSCGRPEHLPRSAHGHRAGNHSTSE